MENKLTHQRLESLDMLRGFDLFMLVAIEPILRVLKNVLQSPGLEPVMRQFGHCEWEGFLMWDLVMPLFLFMAGVSIPFSLSKYKYEDDKSLVYFRIIKRVLLLWLLGAVCQGNLLAFDPYTFRFYSNTLQAIAAGYLIASMVYLHFKVQWQVVVSVAILLVYWAVMMFAGSGDFGRGNFTADNNMSEWIDRVVLGSWRDGVTWNSDGSWAFSDGYRYTWILSSLNFGVTVMTGLFAGTLLKSGLDAKQKAYYLLLIGAWMIFLGWLWGLQMPIIKKIWSSSMVLFSSGLCFILMGIFYYCIDYKNWKKGLGWLKFYGMNSILAYTLMCVVNFSSVSKSFLYGMEQFLGGYYQVLIAMTNAAIVFVILMILYRRRIFLRV